MFAFPDPIENKVADSMDISNIEAGQIKKEWKAAKAVSDNTLPDKLCRALKHILGDSKSENNNQQHLLKVFSPLVQQCPHGLVKPEWLQNSDENEVPFCFTLLSILSNISKE